MTIGQKIKQRREQLKLSKTELGKRLGVTRVQIYRIENGLRWKIKDLDKIQGIAKVLEMDYKDLLP